MESITNYRNIINDADCIEYIKKHRNRIQEEIEIKRNALHDTDFIKYIESELRKFSDKILELRRIIINPMIKTNRIVYININSLENIIELYKAELESVNITKNKLSGFDSILKSNEIALLYNGLINAKYINKKTPISNFQDAFNVKPFTKEFKPIQWIKGKNSCRCLLELISNYENKKGEKYIPDMVKQKIIPKIFKDNKGDEMHIGKPDDRFYQYHLDQFEKMLICIKEKTDQNN